MSDELPVCDVLLEATKYLCKLGSNLRLRSENLKDKRISKEKLRNTHAVQKAADKILLLCNLSKQSLENVEIGVKKILAVCGANKNKRSSASPSRTIPLKAKERINYHYIEYGHRKLKILQKVSLKHYRSVRVQVTNMPSSMVDKYPVNYDCKLYRMRKRNDATKKKLDSDDNDSCTVSKKENNPSKLNIQEVYTESEEEDKSTKHTVPKRRKSIIISSDKEMSDGRRKSVSSTSSDKESTEKEKDIRSPKSKSMDAKRSTDRSKNAKHETPGQKKFRNIKLIDDSSNSSDDNEKNKMNSRKKHIGDDDDIQVLSDDSDQEPEAVHKSRKEVSSETKDDKSNENSDNEAKKPVLKCIDITKLLKPEVVKAVTGKSPKKLNQQEVDSKCRNKDIKNNIKKRRLSIIRQENDSYWEKKREEVRGFKPKKFQINVCRLPPFSEEFLKNNSIKKITQAGNVVAEIKTIIDSTSQKKVSFQEECSNATQEKEKIDDKELTDVTDNAGTVTKAKSALLDDSDSDKGSSSPNGAISSEAKKIRESLLHDSDSSNDNFLGFTNKKRSRKKSDEEEESLDKEEHLQKEKNNSDFNESTQEKIKKKIDNNSNNKIDEEVEISKTKLDKEDSAKENDKVKLSTPDDVSIDNSSSDTNTRKENSVRQCNNDVLKSDANEEIRNPNKNNDKETSENETNKEVPPVSQKTNNAQLDDSESKSSIEEEKSNFTSKDSVKEDTKPSNKSDDEKSEKDSEDNDTRKGNQTIEGKIDSNAKSADEKNEKTPTKKRKKSENRTPQSKRKNIMESMHAKKMLLTYSSSDTEDEQLKNALKDVKNALLEGSDDEPPKEDLVKVCRKKLIVSSSSEESDSGELEKKKLKKCNNDSSEEKGELVQGPTTSISQVDGSVDDESSTSSKMGRSKTKPSASASQNSDSQDSDKDIDGLTNLRSLGGRTRGSTSASKRDEPNSPTRTRSALPKAPAFKAENLLEADSDSNSSIPESGADGEDIDDLPPVTMSSLNGGALQHLAKDDLLDESDASSSGHNKSSEIEDNKRDDETDEENVKSKRRKTHTISSDSEVEARKKDRDVKFSDFDESAAEESSGSSSKKTKRKKKGSDSDASGNSSDARKKKRRRIKQVDDSDASGSESETEGQKRGRKNIRKVMGKDQLEEATKKAAREEKERVARIIERQKMYNNLQFDESGKPDEVVLDRVVLDFDPETKEPLIQLDKGLVKKLKPHQANGIKFMWDACFESVKRIKKDRGSGCILAHCMGLGKTLQVVSLTHTLLTHSDLTKVNRVLVVCPLSTVLNWVNEFTMWLKHTESDYEVDVYELSRFKQNSERAFQLNQWYNGGGVCVLGYEMFRNLSADNPKKYRKKMLRSFQEALVDPGPDMVVCDEGHLLKNEKTSLSQSMNRVRTQRRIVLTGTPLQNNLKEYYCMVQFVKPNLLGKYNEYLNRFVNPITNGQYTDSTEHDIRVMKRRSHVLHKMLDGAVQRRDYGVLAPFLPPKHEYVLFITLTEVQTKLYQFYLENYSRRPMAGKTSGFLFPDFQSLQRIWTHPLVLKYNSERYEIMQQKKRDKEEEEDSEGSLVDFIDDESTPEESSTDPSSDDLSDLSDDSRKKSKKKKAHKKAKKEPKASGRRATRANPVEQDPGAPASLDDLPPTLKQENPTEWWIKLVCDEELDDLRNSHKLVLLFDILRQCEAIGDKLLVFSQSLYSLDLIEHFLGKVDDATQEGRVDEKLGGHVGSWSPGIDYFRLDGSTSCENRSIWCKSFNREDNPRARLFLISTRAGGLGINLVAANRVVIFDVSWNPSHDVQSIFRVYRFGQKKPCYVYRFLAMGTMEEKIYERQVTKQAISKRVIDEQQIDRHYKENDLAELYTFEPKPPEPRPLPPLPKDRLFAEMLKDHDKLIYKYHEHDSLLENKEEETLTEEERKAAWEDFENEKNRPPPAPFPNVWPMQNGMAPGFLAQQQQQIAYAALATMLRKDMPTANESQIRDMLPLIYNANPGLMQKMTEQMFKYAQPGLMNPMMNMAMNAGAAGMGGGSSGLQYEPPWQRQQQQQQQMRLQQLMQHQQNSMGAKYYAGGLGSRDPVAMALQQQQARAISSMAGETRGRPRGRPPLQPRAPPSAPLPAQDVVNLDSD